MPVGQAQLEALGAGARRHRWLQPPLSSAHGLRTAEETHKATRLSHPPAHGSAAKMEISEIREISEGFTLECAPEALCQGRGLSLPVILPGLQDIEVI